jgi:hypothetical protein
MQRRLLLMKEIHNYNITLAWSVLKKNYKIGSWPSECPVKLQCSNSEQLEPSERGA